MFIMLLQIFYHKDEEGNVSEIHVHNVVVEAKAVEDTPLLVKVTNSCLVVIDPNDGSFSGAVKNDLFLTAAREGNEQKRPFRYAELILYLC